MHIRIEGSGVSRNSCQPAQCSTSMTLAISALLLTTIIGVGAVLAYFYGGYSDPLRVTCAVVAGVSFSVTFVGGAVCIYCFSESDEINENIEQTPTTTTKNPLDQSFAKKGKDINIKDLLEQPKKSRISIHDEQNRPLLLLIPESTNVDMRRFPKFLVNDQVIYGPTEKAQNEFFQSIESAEQKNSLIFITAREHSTLSQDEMVTLLSLSVEKSLEPCKKAFVKDKDLILDKNGATLGLTLGQKNSPYLFTDSDYKKSDLEAKNRALGGVFLDVDKNTFTMTYQRFYVIKHKSDQNNSEYQSYFKAKTVISGPRAALESGDYKAMSSQFFYTKGFKDPEEALNAL